MEKDKKESVEDLVNSLFKEDDDLSGFDINKEQNDREKGKETVAQWEDDWDDDDDDDDVTDGFSLQLKNELENVARKSQVDSKH